MAKQRIDIEGLFEEFLYFLILILLAELLGNIIAFLSYNIALSFALDLQFATLLAMLLAYTASRKEQEEEK